MNELLQAFLLGNAAILTNVCVLPLYPGLIAYLAGTAQNERARRASKWLGIFVLAGVLTLMIIVGGILYALQQSFGAVLPFLLPAIYIDRYRDGRAHAHRPQSVQPSGHGPDTHHAEPLHRRVRLRPAAGPDDATLRRTDCGQRFPAGRGQFHRFGRWPAVLSLLRPRLRLAAGRYPAYWPHRSSDS